MRVDLRNIQLPEHTNQGRVTGADRRAYAREGTKARRAVADQLIESGAPLLLEMYCEDNFEWFQGDDARNIWAEVRPSVISTAPTAKQLSRHEMWNAGVWRADDGAPLVYLNGHC